MTQLQNISRIALVTGGLGGIGSGICAALAEAGHTVIACDVAQATSDRLVAALTAVHQRLGDKVHHRVLDVTDIVAAQALVDMVTQQFGNIGILINCAGITRDASFRKMSKADWDAVISTNLDSVFNMTKPVVESMVAANWGRIVNLSSVNATRGQFGQTNYAAAKAGLLGFTKSLAFELSRYGITVNAVSPGYIDTPMTQVMRDEAKQAALAMIPAGRAGTPDDIAAAVAFLCSEGASYVTGSNLAVNGGLFMYQ